MALRRYLAIADTTITNAYKSDLLTRATSSNQGECDTLQVFHIYAQASTSSENSRILIQFPISEISQDRTDSLVPLSGSCNFILKLYNAVHPFTVPKKYYLAINPVSRSWDEGFGKDADDYSDDGYCNWDVASSGTTGITYWTSTGGDFITTSYVAGNTLPHYSYYFEKGVEDLSLDITSLVEEWLAGTSVGNKGIGIYLSASAETAASSSYVKKFFARGTEYFFKRPCIEVQWNDAKKDQRATFYASSSLTSNNTNTIYFYNYLRGRLTDLPFTSQSAQLWTDRVSGSLLTASATVGKTGTGIYTASFILNTTSSYVYDRWFNGINNNCFYTGSAITVNSLESNVYYKTLKYVLSMPDLRAEYSTADDSDVLMRVFIRNKDWSPNIFSVVENENPSQIVEDLYYKIKRIPDDLTVVEFGTGSIEYTKCSYDVSGSYFKLDCGLLESGYTYKIQYCYKTESGNFRMLKDEFKFRVIE